MTLEYYLNQYHSKGSVKTYLSAIHHFLLHSKHKEHSTYSDIIDYFTEHPITATHRLCGIKKYFDYLVDTGKRADHPCRHLTTREPIRPVQFQDLFSPDELQQLLHRKERYPMLKERNHIIISLLIHQALTPANIVNLSTKDLDIPNGTLYIKSTSKINRRTLTLKPNQFMLFYHYLHDIRPKLGKTKTDQLLVGKLGNPISVDTINRMLLLFKPSFPHRNLNAQTIRKSVISNWLNEEKIPLEDVQLLSGQKRISTTERYIKPDAEKKKGMINEFFPI